MSGAIPKVPFSDIESLRLAWGCSQKTMTEALGLKEAAYSKWKTSGEVPAKYIDILKSLHRAKPKTLFPKYEPIINSHPGIYYHGPEAYHLRFRMGRKRNITLGYYRSVEEAQRARDNFDPSRPIEEQRSKYRPVRDPTLPKGVYPSGHKWMAVHNHKHIGLFDTIYEAAEAKEEFIKSQIQK